MAYDATDLKFNSTLFIAGAHQLNWQWDYTTTDPLAEIEAGLGTTEAPYFNNEDAKSRLRTNDLLRVSASDGNGLYMISGNGPTSLLYIVKLAVVSAFVPWVSP